MNLPANPVNFNALSGRGIPAPESAGGFIKRGTPPLRLQKIIGNA